MILDSIHAISVMIFLISLAIYPSSVQSTKEAVQRVTQSYKSCRGDYDLMFKKGVDMYSLETIDQMIDTATSKPIFIEVIDSIGVLMAKLLQIPSNTIDEVQLHMGVLRNKMGNAVDHINDIPEVVLNAAQFQSYRDSRKALKHVMQMFHLWLKDISDSSAYREVENSCRLKNMYGWFSDLKVDLDAIWALDKNMPQWIMANTKNSRADITRLVAQIKADMCDAALLLSICVSVKKMSVGLKTRQLSVVDETLERFKNRFKDVDKFLITSARSGIIKDSREAIKSMAWLTQDTIANQVYDVLASKYYWLNLNVALYEGDSYVSFQLHPTAEVDCLVRTAAVYAPATQLKWKALVYAWKKSVDPTALAHLANQSHIAKDKLDAHVYTINNTPASGYCEMNGCWCFNASNIYGGIWQFLQGGAGTHPSFVLFAYRLNGLFTAGIHYGNTVGIQIDRNGTYMLSSKGDKCGRWSAHWDIVFFLGSYCPDKPFSYF